MSRKTFMANLYAYYELEYKHPTHPKYLYLIGEAHNMSECDKKFSNVIEPENIIQTIQHTSDNVVDIFVEAHFPSKKAGYNIYHSRKLSRSRMGDYIISHTGCIQYEKINCDLYNARFHYIDSREYTFFIGRSRYCMNDINSIFCNYAIFSRPKVFDDIKQYFLDIIDGKNMEENPLHQIESAHIVPSTLKLPHVNHQMASYLDSEYKRHRETDKLYLSYGVIYIYLSDYRYLLSKIQKQFRNCEQEFVAHVRVGLEKFIELYRADVENKINLYLQQFEQFFKKANPKNRSTWIPIEDTTNNTPFTYLYILIQDLYAIGRAFRTKWDKPHEPSKNQVMYTGGAHSYSTFCLLKYVPEIRLKAGYSKQSEFVGNCITVQRY